MGRFRPGDRYDRVGNYSFEDTGLIGETTVSNHVGYSYHPCPFSTQIIAPVVTNIFGTTDPYKRLKVLLSDIYTEVLDGTDYLTVAAQTIDIPSGLVDHTYSGKIYYLQAAYKGTWGFECTFPGCPYKTIMNMNYFYT